MSQEVPPQVDRRWRAFTDRQVRGPYHTWIHRHDFEEDGEATVMTDIVRYRLPLWPVGEVALPIVAATTVETPCIRLAS